MNNILAVDTSTKVLSVTLLQNKNISNTVIDEGFTHSEKLVPLIDLMLKDAGIKLKELDLLVCTNGPGSFTGLRIGMSTLKGISLGLNIPLVSIPTLDPYGRMFSSEKATILPIIDARKKCYYTALYKEGSKVSKDLDISIDDLNQLLISEESIILTGPDSAVLYPFLVDNSKFLIKQYSHEQFGKSLINLGIERYHTVGPDSLDIGPTYIRKSDAEILLKEKASTSSQK